MVKYRDLAGWRLRSRLPALMLVGFQVACGGESSATRDDHGGSGGKGGSGGSAGTSGSNGSAGTGDVRTARLTGVVQKGAFARGSALVALELDGALVQTGRSFTTETSDNTGRYEVSLSSVTGSYVKLTANGFYYNEVTGDDAEAPLQLVALASLEDGATVNVNVLTHLETPRVEYLVSRGKTFDAAKAQAESELLAAFEIDAPRILPAQQLDAVGGSQGDAALLAASTLVQGYLSVRETSELLSVIAQDLRQDGTLDDEGAGRLLMNSASLMSPALVGQRLSERYAELGVMVELGDFESHVQHFRDAAPYPLLSRIEFPETGIYGPNVMATPGEVPVGDQHSLSALVPAGEPARFRMTWTGDTSMAGVWFYSDTVNITGTNFDFETGIQDFTVVDPGSSTHLHLSFQPGNAGAARIDVYEGEAGALTTTRELSWGP